MTAPVITVTVTAPASAAVLSNSALVGYFVPVEAIPPGENRVATLEEVRAGMASTRASVQPVLDYLRDK